jgi:hypothetical protein
MKMSSRLASCRTRMSRLLAFVLLVGFVYAVTFGSAHNHETASSRSHTNTTTSVVVQANPSFLVPTQRSSHQQECLICLFHQQLFSGILHAPLYIEKPAIRFTPVSSPRVFFYSSSLTSASTTRLSGRAPPIC